MNSPLVSIIMPAYNSQLYISRAIESVLKQTYQNWELLIVDDGSFDNTRSIIEKFARQDTRIIPILCRKNSGQPSRAKNKALKQVAGSFVAFLDSDDMWRADKLRLQIDYLQVNEDIALLYSGGYWIDENDKIIKAFLPLYQSKNRLHDQLKRYEINNQSVLIKTSALKSTIERFNETITIGEDYNLFMHVTAKYPTNALNEHLVYYRIHKQGLTKQTKRVSDGVLVTLKELSQTYQIKARFPFSYALTYLKAMRFKYFKKRWH